VKLSELAQVIYAIATLVAAVGSVIGATLSARGLKSIVKVEHQTNSLVTELAQTKLAQGHAEGIAQAHAEAKAEAKAPP